MNKIYQVDKTQISEVNDLTVSELGERIFPRLPNFFRSYLDYSVLDEIGEKQLQKRSLLRFVAMPITR